MLGKKRERGVSENIYLSMLMAVTGRRGGKENHTAAGRCAYLLLRIKELPPGGFCFHHYKRERSTREEV